MSEWKARPGSKPNHGRFSEVEKEAASFHDLYLRYQWHPSTQDAFTAGFRLWGHLHIHRLFPLSLTTILLRRVHRIFISLQSPEVDQAADPPRSSRPRNVVNVARFLKALHAAASSSRSSMLCP